jgi:hypothetical protein
MDTLVWFYNDWMNGYPVAACIDDASDPALHVDPFPVPGNERLIVDLLLIDQPTAPIIVIGHSGLTVNGCADDYDGEYTRPSSR